MKRTNTKQEASPRSKKKRKVNDGDAQPAEVPDEAQDDDEETSPMETSPIVEAPAAPLAASDSSTSAGGAPPSASSPSSAGASNQHKYVSYPYPYYSPFPGYSMPYQSDCAQCMYDYCNYYALYFQRMAAGFAYQAQHQQHQHANHHGQDKSKAAGEGKEGGESGEGDPHAVHDGTDGEHRDAATAGEHGEGVAGEGTEGHGMPPHVMGPHPMPHHMPMMPMMAPIPVPMPPGLTSPSSEQKQRGPRRPYLCSKCGRPKKGHNCSISGPSTPGPASEKQGADGSDKAPKEEAEGAKPEEKPGDTVMATFDPVDNDLHEMEKHLQQA